MKLFNKILFGIAVCAALVGTNASAQVDYFAQPRSVKLLPDKFLSTGFTNEGASTLSTTWTNYIDAHQWDGIAKLDLIVFSNTAGAAITASLSNSLVASPDLTNWYTLTAVAYAIPYSIIYTNPMWGSNNLIATDNYLLPGTVTTVTTGTAGYAPPNGVNYLLPAPYTNTANFVTSSNGVYEYGFNIADLQSANPSIAVRYLGLITTLTGSNATYNVQGVLTGRKSQ